MTRIVAIRTTRYPLILMLWCDVFKFLVKQGVLSDEDFEWLSQKLGKLNTVERRLEVEEARVTAFDNENMKFSEIIHRIKTYKTYRDA